MSILEHTAHRPYPLPTGRWIMRQTWYNLLFAHWPIAPAVLQAKVPAPLELDVRDGQAWIALVPFGMSRVYPRYTLPVPGLSYFLELNVRTYVTYKGQPGVYFLSLDAANWIAVRLARAWYKLPYSYAKMSMQEDATGWLNYRSTRLDAPKPADFAGRYRPVGKIFQAQPDSLEAFLTERYCLYTSNHGDLYRGEVHHLPWPLQLAEAELTTNTLATVHGLDLCPQPPLLHFAKHLDTIEWSIEKIAACR